MGGAHLQCMDNNYGKYENKGFKTVGLTDYTNQTPPTYSNGKKCLSLTPVKLRKYSSNVHKKEMHIFNM